VVRDRVEGLATARGLDLQRLPLYVITASSLRLDHRDDRDRLCETVAKITPVLLVLDPFVRLHAIDELCDASHNSSHVTGPVM
jgi:hypothetical protein